MSSAREVVERLRRRRVVDHIDTAEGKLYVRGLSGKERSAYYGWIENVRGEAFSQQLLSDHKLLAIALCDEKGASLFEADDESQQAGLEVVQDWNAEDVKAAAKKVLALSGIGKDAEEDAEKK